MNLLNHILDILSVTGSNISVSQKNIGEKMHDFALYWSSQHHKDTSQLNSPGKQTNHRMPPLSSSGTLP